MKRTISINLGGRAFQITEEAYSQLDDYLNSITACFKNNEYGEEIATDIESRISELCEERMRQSHSEVIDLPLVNEMINRMGKPEAMVEDGEALPNEQEEKQQAKEEEKDFFEKLRLNKKYYLNKDDRMIGGVVSGLAAYCKIDVTLLRILAIILIIPTGLFGIITYLVVWCVAPTASTTTEKLRMQGIEPTPEKIAEKITTEEPIVENKKSNNESDIKREGNTKNILLAIAIILGIIIIAEPNISVTGNNPFIYIFVISFISTILLFITLVALKITKLLNNKLKKIIIVSLIITSILTIFTFLHTQIG